MWMVLSSRTIIGTKMKIFIASDHAGFVQKAALVELLKDQSFSPQGTEVIDLGPPSADSVHYPNYAIELCKNLLIPPPQGEGSKGILICGTGLGMAIVANKFKGIRATPCRDEEEAKLSREHNDANVLCLGSRTTSLEKMKEILRTWLKTPGPEAGSRHCQRLEMVANLGQGVRQN